MRVALQPLPHPRLACVLGGVIPHPHTQADQGVGGQLMYPRGCIGAGHNFSVEKLIFTNFFNISQLSYEPSNFARANKPYALG